MTQGWDAAQQHLDSLFIPVRFLVDVVGCVVLGAAILVVLGGEVSMLCQCV